MSDAQLRELDRRWRREASVEAWTTYAAACARAGLRAPPADEADAWAPRRLALAARLGDPDARRALALPDEPEPDDAYAWVKRLSSRSALIDAPRWERELFVRVGVAAARTTLDLSSATLREALSAVDAWVAGGASSGDRGAVWSGDPKDLAMRMEGMFSGNRAARVGRTRAVLAVSCACATVSSNDSVPFSAGSAALHASLSVGVPTVVAAIRRELLPWVLFARG